MLPLSLCSGPLRHSRDTRAPCARYCLHRGPHAAQVAPPGFSKAIKSKVKAITSHMCIRIANRPRPAPAPPAPRLGFCD